ncbi:hect domain and RLD 2 [Cryptosporidium ryanae]|uniref:hect domain and RLD 2 n=1 Tax=Cryptosporidium ryanae TaxID=515981 RepID=UPI00351A4EC8|nr:hect domain and RLD 2 [Cryptosporidium ryanae]
MYETQDSSLLPGIPDFIKEANAKKILKNQVGDSFGGHTFSRAACSLSHYFVVAKYKNKGQLYGWGLNANNVLGFGINNELIELPTRVNFFSTLDVFQVSCGYSHTAVLVKGISEASESWFTPRPCIVNFPNGAKISRISCGANHTLALSDVGHVYSWGIGQYGCLGTGELNDVYFPVKIDAGPDNKKVLHIAAGARHSLCCNEEGRVFAWGTNSNGRLGIGGSHGIKLTPTQIKSLSPYHITIVAAGESHSGCIDSFGYIYTWGSGGSGKLGHGSQNDCNIPRRIEGLSSLPFVQLTLGAFSSMALSQSGDLYIWGGRQHELILLPTKYDAFQSTICHIYSGPYISFAMDVRYNVYMWNNRLLVNSKRNEAKTLTEDQIYKRMNSKNPVILPFFQSNAFVDDCIFYMGFNLVDYKGNKLSFESKSEGGIFSVDKVFGTENNSGMGLGSLVKSPLPAWSVRQISCGMSHTLLLIYGGSIFRSTESSSKNESNYIDEPVEIKFSEPIRRIACGYWHSLCCDIKGNCYTWGRGDRGQLGNGTIRNIYEPTGIVTLNNVIDVAGGELYSACIVTCITTKDKDFDRINSGQLWIWGDGDFGKLGFGDNSLKSCIAAPRHLNLGVPIIKVALGTSHTLALTLSRELITWGAGYYGRLGVNSTKSHSNPIKVKFPIKGVEIVDIAVGTYHSMAVSSIGDVWVWGKGENILSDKDVLIPNIFAKLESPTGVPRVYSVHAFGDVSYVITQTGHLWVWGPEISDQEIIGQLKLDNNTKIISHTGKPELVVLPGNVIGVSGSSMHHVCLLSTGEVLSWGDPSNGKLGQSLKKSNKYIKNPGVVIPKWSDAKVILNNSTNNNRDSKNILFSEKEKSYNKEEEVTTIEELNTFINLLTSNSVKFSKEAKSFEYVQSLLYREDPRTRKDYISLLEEDLVLLFSRHIDYFNNMKQAEERLTYLTFLAEVQMRRLVDLINKKIMERNIIVEDNNYYTIESGIYYNNIILKYMGLIEYVFSLVRMQPLYIINLMLECEFGYETITVLNCINGLFPSNIECSSPLSTINYNGLSDSMLILEVIGELLCKRELQMALSTNNIFWPGYSKFLYYLSCVTLRGSELTSLIKSLLDIYNPNSLVSIISKFPNNILLVLDTANLSQYLGIDPKDESISNKYLEMLRYAEVALITGLAENINNNIIFPKILERLLYKAWKFTTLMEIPSFNPLYDYKQQKDQSIQQPLLRLLLYGIILPILEQSNAYCTYYYLPLITDMRILSSLQIISHSIKIFLSGKIYGLSSSQGYMWINILSNFTNSITLKLSELINNQKDVNDLSLTYISYNSQYSLNSDNYHVILNLVDAMTFINLIQKYKNFLRLNIMDPLINSIEYFVRKDKLTVPFFPQNYIEVIRSQNLLPNSNGGGIFISLRLSPRWMVDNNIRQSKISNFLKVDNITNKLYNNKNSTNKNFEHNLDKINYDEMIEEEKLSLPPLDTSLMFCPITKIGMSQSLIPRFESNIRKPNGLSEFGLFIRYYEVPDKRRIIEKGLMILPLITARSMYELLESVDEYIEQFKRKENDKKQYNQLSNILEFKKIVEELQYKYKDDIVPLLLWITNDIKDRLRHRAYLEHLVKIEEKLNDKKTWYKEKLSEWENSIEKSMINMTYWGYKDKELKKLLNIFYENKKIGTVMGEMESILYNLMMSGYLSTEDDLAIMGNNNYTTTDIIKKSITLPLLTLPLNIFILNGIIYIKSDERIINLFESERKRLTNFLKRQSQMNNWSIIIMCTPTLGIDCTILTNKLSYRTNIEQRIICRFYITPEQVKKAKLVNYNYTRLYSNGLVEVNLPRMVNYIYSQI